jgi:hypothetical protein
MHGANSKLRVAHDIAPITRLSSRVRAWPDIEGGCARSRE